MPKNITPSPALPPALAIIAATIRDRVTRTAYEIGQDLIEAKGLCQHGEWQPFLRAAGIKPRTAQEMMQYVRLIGPGADTKALPPVHQVLGQARIASKTAESAHLKHEPSPPDVQLNIVHQMFSDNQSPKVRRAARMLMSAWLEEHS